jgi:hypothetical protein
MSTPVHLQVQLVEALRRFARELRTNGAELAKLATVIDGAANAAELDTMPGEIVEDMLMRINRSAEAAPRLKESSDAVVAAINALAQGSRQE